jgi:RNA polymerase sigma-70 factor (ECF subfamily)
MAVLGMAAPLARDAARRPPALDEDALVERVLAGDERAAHQVLAHVGPAVLRTIRGVLGSEDADVDDLVQESFVALLGALPAFRGDCGLRSFATRIAAKLAMSGLRRRYRRKAEVPGDASAFEGPADLDAALQQDARLAWVRSEIARLPRVQGEVVLLRWLLGHSLAEVAAITGAPVNTVRSRLRLGRNALVERLRAHPAFHELQEEVP